MSTTANNKGIAPNGWIQTFPLGIASGTYPEWTYIMEKSLPCQAGAIAITNPSEVTLQVTLEQETYSGAPSALSRVIVIPPMRYQAYPTEPFLKLRVEASGKAQSAATARLAAYEDLPPADINLAANPISSDIWFEGLIPAGQGIDIASPWGGSVKINGADQTGAIFLKIAVGYSASLINSGAVGSGTIEFGPNTAGQLTVGTGAQSVGSQNFYIRTGASCHFTTYSGSVLEITNAELLLDSGSALHLGSSLAMAYGRCRIGPGGELYCESGYAEPYLDYFELNIEPSGFIMFNLTTNNTTVYNSRITCWAENLAIGSTSSSSGGYALNGADIWADEGSVINTYEYFSGTMKAGINSEINITGTVTAAIEARENSSITISGSGYTGQLEVGSGATYTQQNCMVSGTIKQEELSTCTLSPSTTSSTDFQADATIMLGRESQAKYALGPGTTTATITAGTRAWLNGASSISGQTISIELGENSAIRPSPGSTNQTSFLADAHWKVPDHTTLYVTGDNGIVTGGSRAGNFENMIWFADWQTTTGTVTIRNTTGAMSGTLNINNIPTSTTTGTVTVTLSSYDPHTAATSTLASIATSSTGPKSATVSGLTPNLQISVDVSSGGSFTINGTLQVNGPVQ